MSKKIGIFLMVLLVIWSVLLLDATKNRQPIRTPESTGTSTEPSQSETLPEITIPSDITIPGDAPTASAERARVEAVLEGQTMERTAATHLIWVGKSGDSRTGALAELASRRKVNPIAAFWVLVSEGLYERDGEKPGLPIFDLKELPSQEKMKYSYTDAGAEALLTDFLTLAGQMADGLELEQAILGPDGAVDPGQVLLSEQDGCRYAYFARIAEGSSQILCFYLRGDEWITDVEFQLLHMTGGTDPEQGNGQAAALAAAAELLMTGTARAGAEDAAAYDVGGCKATAERFFFTSEEEEGSLTNYRLRK